MLGWLKAIPVLLNLLSSLFSFLKSEKDKESGRIEEKEKELEVTQEQETKADQIRTEADTQHNKDQTDDAYDNDFKRPD